MTLLLTDLPGLTLVKPNPKLHAPLTLSWFTSKNGKETLLLMGNAEHEIETPSLENEIKILEEFIDLEKRNEQLTWMIEFSGKIVGVAWIELVQNHNVLPPSVHIMIGDKNYRGRGIGKTVMQALIRYIKQTRHPSAIYSRHLTDNTAIAALTRNLGFINDGSSYIDEHMLEWQNIKMPIQQ